MRAATGIVCLLLLGGCGFKPIYATADNQGVLVSNKIKIAAVRAPEDIHLNVSDALRERMGVDEGVAPDYSLDVVAKDESRRLAVQIDATVTRYNYRLSSSYRLTRLSTRETISGTATAVTSYNIVSSQYSTLFAEKTAREKAARLLAENIERDILLRLSDPEGEDQFTDSPIALDAPPDNPLEIREVGEQRDSFDDDNQPFFIDDDEPRAAPVQDSPDQGSDE